jgi:hypothetical protein
MNVVRGVLIADGSSDAILLGPLKWLAGRLRPDLALDVSIAPNCGSLADRMAEAFRDPSPDLVFVHRDAEKETAPKRREEIAIAWKLAPASADVWVPIVPVRMTEAWFLFDEKAIRWAAGNPNGSVVLTLPSKNKWESQPDPKKTLFDALKVASGLRGRRLSKFNLDAARRNLAEFIEDYSVLSDLPAFSQLETDFRAAFEKLRPEQQGTSS